MTDQPLHTPERLPDDPDAALRPKTLNEFIGQEAARENLGVFIAAEATLTFLGIGLQAPEISWGLQINLGQNVFLTSPYLVLFPAGFLSVTVLAFIMLGDALRDALDPKRK